jgi:hypothetical protein
MPRSSDLAIFVLSKQIALPLLRMRARGVKYAYVPHSFLTGLATMEQRPHTLDPQIFELNSKNTKYKRETA